MTPTIQEDQKLYVIQHELGPVKIGIAKQPRERLAQLQTSTPFELKLRKTASPRDAHTVEQYLHRRFSRYHIRGEWFDVPVNERDFGIPNRIDDGVPDIDVQTDPDRDIHREWGDGLERFFRAFLDTKYLTDDITEIRDRCRELHESIGPDRSEDEDVEVANTLSSMDDTPEDKKRCSQCGHLFDRSHGSCPTCSSGDFLDGGIDYDYRR